MIEAVEALNAKKGETTLGVGIGVNAGDVVFGAMGALNRLDFTVIGDSVNLAARLESNARPGQILISHRTYERVRDLVDARPLGRIRVKGKEEEVEVYEVARLAPVV